MTGETSCATLVGPLTKTRPLVDISALIEACPFVDPERKQALLRRAGKVFPVMPDVSFLEAALPAALESSQPATAEERPLISVIIAIRNWGLDRLELSLRSIREGEAGSQMEIVLLDYGSDDRTAVAAVGDRFDCKNIYIEALQWSRSQAINAAVTYATAPYIVTGDADILFGPRTLITLHDHLEAVPQAVHAMSYFDLPQEFSTEGIKSHAELPWDTFTSSSSVRPRWGMGGAACSIELFETVRGYDERMVVWGAEDKDFVARCQSNGFPVHWIEHPDVRLYHVWHKQFLSGGSSHVDVHVHNKRLMADQNLERNYTPGVRLKNRNPLVSVVIASRNRSALLLESIRSVVGQTMQDFEIVIVDDGSTDDTAAAVLALNDPRIHLERLDERHGLPAARNIGNRTARGKYIAIHDDDDLMLPDRLERQIAAIRPGDAGSYGGWIDFTMADEGANIVCNSGRSPFELGPLMFSNKLQIHPALMIRRDVCLQNPYEESFSGGSDYHLVSRLAVAGYRMNHCGRYIVLRRLHGENMTRNGADTQKIASRMTRSSVLGFLPETVLETLRQQGQATPPHTIVQPELPEQVARLIGEDYLCATDRVAYDETLWLELERQQVSRSLRLHLDGRKIVPGMILLDRRQRATYEGLLSGHDVSGGVLRLRRTLWIRSFNTRLSDRYLDENRLRAPNRGPLSQEIEFAQEVGERVVCLRFSDDDWPGLSKLEIPFDADEPVLLVFDSTGHWNLLFKLEDEFEFSIRTLIVLMRYPSLSMHELTKKDLV